jgi:hypothetical protein
MASYLLADCRGGDKRCQRRASAPAALRAIGLVARLEHARGELPPLELLGELEPQVAAVGEPGDLEVVALLDEPALQRDEELLGDAVPP